MKIALCHESVLPNRGGCETYVVSLARRLLADGHRVQLYARRWDAAAMPPGIDIHPVLSSARPRMLRQWFFSSLCHSMLAEGDHDVSLGFDKVCGVDVLYPQAGSHPAAVEATLRKYPSALMRGLLRLVRWFDPAEWSFWATERAACRHPGTSVVAISEMVRGQLQSAYGIEPERLSRLYGAVLPERFIMSGRQRRREEARRRWGLSSRPVALFAAINYRLKGLEPLLYAMAQVSRPLDLVVVGHENIQAFVQLAGQLGISDRVRFVGFCPDMRDAYFGCDLLVHPTFYDPCSTVVLEALACGLPVITTAYNGAAELLTPAGPDGVCREGFVLPDPHDHARLGWCLNELADEGNRDSCAAEAVKAARRWTFENHYQGLMGILIEAARRRGKGPGISYNERKPRPSSPAVEVSQAFGLG
jgi:UDP-glucose:(heptosyl)LPS alpha-1,3-glucosyltransferase